MRVPLSWLREFVDVDLPVQEVADRLTMLGLEVEAVEEVPGIDGEPDWVLVTYVSPNRGDWLSVRGVARELAASLQMSLREPPIRLDETEPPTADGVAVRIEDPDLCPRYVARLVRNVRVKPSPAWMVRRLEACGVRSINNVVDVTNYVLLELGQPLHAFDFDKLEGGQIIVRRARPGETITTLDGKERELFPEALVIADRARPVALAGVMGGQLTEVTADTAHVLLESAHFNPVNNRRTSRRLGLQTESSYRFSRTVDPMGCGVAADRAAALLADLAEGEVASGQLDVFAKPHEAARIFLRVDRVNALLGTELGSDEIVSYLKRLGFEVSGEGPLGVVVPSFRPDVQREADLIEEVARLHGYDAVPTSLPRVHVAPGTIGPRQRLANAARELLVQFGLTEVITYSLTSPEMPELLGLAEDDPRRQFVAVANPMSLEASVLRSQLSASVLGVVVRNLRRRNRDVAIFEVGKTYHPLAADRSRGEPASPPDERLATAIALTGSLYGSRWNVPEENRAADFFVLKAIVTELLEILVGASYEFRAGGCDLFSPECRAEIMGDGLVLGACGRVQPKILERMEAPADSPVFLAEIALEPLVGRERPFQLYRPISRFPENVRDLAFVVDQSVPYEQVRRAVMEAGGPLLDQVVVFDVFSRPPLPPGKKNVAFTLSFRSPERTITDEEVDAHIGQIIAHAQTATGAVLRE